MCISNICSLILITVYIDTKNSFVRKKFYITSLINSVTYKEDERYEGGLTYKFMKFVPSLAQSSALISLYHDAFDRDFLQRRQKSEN